MNLNSTQDIILLRNCIIVKIKQLKLNMAKSNTNFPDTQKALDHYTKLLELLNNSDTENVVSLLQTSVNAEDFSQFNEHIFSTPASEIATEYLELTKKMMMDNNSYSDKQFEKLKKAFYKGNEHLNQEENFPMPEKKSEQQEEHLTEDLQKSLEYLNKLIWKINPHTATPADFKKFAESFRDLTKFLGMKKFQQYFDEHAQTIRDMQISYDTESSGNMVYKTDFTLVEKNAEETHFSLQKPAVESIYVMDYYQNLCYSYLEADKYSFMNESELSAEIIHDKIINFRECYTKLKDMSKYKIDIKDNKIIFSSKSEIEPTELELEACNSEPYEQKNSEDTGVKL